MNQQPTWTLTERIPAEVPLTPEDVDFLLAHHRAHLQLWPTRQAGVFRITATGHVGAILAPGCRLLLQPKIPIRNVLYLLDDHAGLPALTDTTTATPGGDVLELLAAQLAHRLTERDRRWFTGAATRNAPGGSVSARPPGRDRSTARSPGPPGPTALPV